MTKYNYHFTMRNATTGEIYEQDRMDWSMEDFVVDMLLNGNVFAYDIESVKREPLYPTTPAEALTIDTPSGLKKLLQDVADELEYRVQELDSARGDVAYAIEHLA